MHHTPGPWTLTDEDSPLVSDADGAYIAQVFSRTGCDNGSLRPAYAADSRLICAAPAMLDALQRCAAILARYPKHDDVWAQARAAIRAATGEV